MPKSTKTPAKPAKRAAAKSAARNTDSGPSEITGALFDANTRKMAQTQELVAAMPDNPNKPAEHGQGGTGLVFAEAAEAEAAAAEFIAGVARHRHFGREMDPPLI